MIYRKFFMIFSIALLGLTPSIWSIEKSNIKVTKIDNYAISNIRVRPTLSTADTCIVRQDQGIYWKIGNWVEGNELYKSYLDPALSCPNPYPFAVTEINMPMHFDSAISFIVSVDVETVDDSDPNCPYPDTIMLGISSAYTITIQDTGTYNIWIQFDEPIIVNGPFFAGFFLGDIDPLNIPSVFTDDNILTCVSYNVWEDTLGFVDLMNYNFPGRLVLYASGIPGGGILQPTPQLSILSPNNNDKEYKTTEIWVEETSGSSIIEYVSFSYASDSNFIEIGRDYDGTKSFRDGLNPRVNESGYSYSWDFSSIPEDTYNIRVTAVDTLGRFASEDISLFLEPTPPIAEIVSPTLGANFCPKFNILMSSNDDNLNSVTLSYSRSNPNFSINAQTLLMSNFGNYYSSAIAVSLSLQALEDRGLYYLMRDGNNVQTTTQMASTMAEYFDIATNNGVYDENILNGLKQFNSTISNVLHIDYMKLPKYLDLRTQIELNGNVAIAGLGGTSNNWILIDGFYGTVAIDGTYLMTISNPLNAQIDTVQLRNQIQGCEIQYNGDWQPIEMIILLGTDGWNSKLTSFGFDFDRSDGWSYSWIPPSLYYESEYFIQSKGTDLTSLKGSHTIMLTYDCTKFYNPGDYNNDGTTDLIDLEILMNYFTNNGPPPDGGDGRADANCDGYLNITDIIYYMNFIFGVSPTPCF